MGLTSAGTSIEVVRVSDYYVDLMMAYEGVIRENIGELMEMARAVGGNPGDKLTFVLKIEDRKIFAYEMNYYRTWRVRVAQVKLEYIKGNLSTKLTAAFLDFIFLSLYHK